LSDQKDIKGKQCRFACLFCDAIDTLAKKDTALKS